MIFDITGIELTPGSGGKNCLGNGSHFIKGDEPLECCLDECDYYICCFCPELKKSGCADCRDLLCPNSKGSE